MDVEDYFENQEKKSKIIKIIVIGSVLGFLFFALLLIFLNRIVPIKDITVSQDNVKLSPGESFSIVATVLPSNATSKDVIWKSSNPKVVDVSNDGSINVISYSEEDVVITVSSRDGKVYKEILVDVLEPKYVNISSIKFDAESVSLNYGQVYTLSPIIYPDNASDKNLIWSSSDPELVSVSDSGVVSVIANKDGEAIISASSKDNSVKSSIKIQTVHTDIKVSVSDIKFDKTEVVLKYGSSLTLKPIISPSNATNKSVKWTSSDTNLVVVDSSGKIKAKSNKNGEAIITAVSVDGSKTAQVKVNVKYVDQVVKVKSVKINNPSQNILYLNKKGNNTITMTATVSPSDADNKSVSWSSSNTSVASIDSNGKVTPKSLGSTKITVKTKDGGYTASYTIKVMQKNVIVISASSGLRMYDYFKEYTSNKSNYYSYDNNTLRYVFKSGSGFDYQYGDGFDIARKFLEQSFSNKREFIEVHLFFTMTGNSVKTYTCDKIKTTSDYTTIASKYNSAVSELKKLGYSVKGYVISHSPLNTKHSLAKENKIVYSNDENACSSGYRSAWKYYLSNNRMKSIIATGNYNNIKFVDNWSNFLKIVSEEERTFKWLRDFTTPSDDPLHWDKDTTIRYMQLAFDTAGL